MGLLDSFRQNKLRACVICKVAKRRSETAKTCSQSCAAKLAWQTRTN
jgi:hypothetical protein